MAFKFEKLRVWQRAVDFTAEIDRLTKGFHSDERFILASRSGIEVVSCLYVGKKRNIVSQVDFDVLYKEAEEIIVMVQALKKGLR